MVDKRLDELREQRLKLVRYIGLCNEYKSHLVKDVEKLNYEFKLGVITYVHYKAELDKSLDNKELVGKALKFIDDGYDYTKLMGLALKLAGATTGEQVVEKLYFNLFNTDAPDALVNAYASKIDSGQLSAGALGVLASNLEQNAININLTGLAEIGLEYIPA